jgi:tetratricopeptide (TPR) repeat protein
MKSNSNSVRFELGRVELLVVLLCLTLAFGLAARVGPQVEARLAANGVTDDNPVARWLGDSRQMFANSFFVKADAYYHSGYYPTIYDDNTPFKTPHIGEDSSTMKSKNSGDETTIFGHPNNWVERFELNFFPSYHTHLDEGGVDGNGAEEVKEIMPWLKISAELDEHRIDTYLVTAYWLRRRMHKVDEAEQFLRDGLRANPGNPAILYELGQLYFEDRHNPDRARNLYLAALASWQLANPGKIEKDQDPSFIYEHITSALAKLELQEHNIPQAIGYFKLLMQVSPTPDAVQKWIDELKPTTTQTPIAKP